MNDWKECKLGDVADRIGMGPFGSNIKISTFVNEGIPVISGTHLRGIRLEDKDYNFITVEHANRLQSANVFRGDVIFTHAGNIGQVAFIPNDSKYERYIISQRQFYLRCRKDALIPEYLTYYFKSYEGQYKLLANANQTGVPSLAQPVSYLKTIEILLPPLPEQRAIASVLSSLDDKIDLLHRQNKTLEGMAETLWRKMFVEEADPNWKRGKLGDLATFSNGKERPEEVINGRIPIFGGNGIMGFTNKSNAEGESIIIGRVGAYCGSLYIETRPVWITDNALLAKPMKRDYSKYLFYLLKSQELNSMAEGSSHPLLTQTLLNSIEIDIPAESEILYFGSYANIWLNKIDFNNFQISTLERLRDTLLPKLMSGEVRVKV